MPQFKTWFQTCGAKSWQSFSLVFMSWKTKSWKTWILLILLKFYIAKKNQDLDNQVLSRAIIVKTWGHGVAKKRNVSRLGRPVLKEKCKISDLLLPVLTIMFTCGHVLQNQVMKVLFESNVQILYPKSLKTWKAKSWIVQPLSRLGDMELQKCSV